MAHLEHHSSTPYCVQWCPLGCVGGGGDVATSLCKKTYQTKSLSPIPPCCANLVLQIVVIVVPP